MHWLQESKIFVTELKMWLKDPTFVKENFVVLDDVDRLCTMFTNCGIAITVTEIIIPDNWTPKITADYLKSTYDYIAIRNYGQDIVGNNRLWFGAFAKNSMPKQINENMNILTKDGFFLKEKYDLYFHGSKMAVGIAVGETTDYKTIIETEHDNRLHIVSKPNMWRKHDPTVEVV